MDYFELPMRFSIVRLIAAREIRDLLRDRRTLLLILVLPVLLYPLFGLAGLLFAQSMLDQTSRVGVVGIDQLPKSGPPLIVGDKFDPSLMKSETKEELLKLAVVPLDGDPEGALKSRTVEVVLIVTPGFAAALDGPALPTIQVLDRDADEKSKLAARRLDLVLRAWAAKLREAKFERNGLPRNYDKVFEIRDSQSKKPASKKAADELRDTFVKAFPFILMMWLVAGAIQPAVDLTAGEKERGTMETLLISPAGRSEIVLGKFFAVFTFTFGSVIWNVLWLFGAAVVMEYAIPAADGEHHRIINRVGLLGCLALGVPLAMFFSAVSIAFGVFARSTKEGQYYLMPLMLLSMPLAIWSMMPGMDLTYGRALIPVTGAMLLQQKFLSVSAEPVPWGMLVPVLGALAVSIAIALWLAVIQFRRESVLFRETGPTKRGSLLAMFRGE